MEPDDGLMLNLTSSSTFDDIGSSNAKTIKRPAKWRQKVPQKFRKPTSHPHDHPSPGEDFTFTKAKKDASFVDKPRVKKSADDHSTSKAKDSSKSKEPHQVISSLFRHNPAIPHIKRDEIKDRKPIDNKPLFTGDKFSELSLSPHMISNLEKNLEVTTLTSVQKTAIPTLLGGEDVFIKSRTGSGKTLCYAVPVVHTLQRILPKIERVDGPYAIVLVPTRELALQSFNILLKLVKPFQWVVPGLVIGGEKRKSEKARLRKGINILVATPGRLLDHIEKTQCLKFDKIKWIILDEADRLLDMGFEKDVSAIIDTVKQQQNKESHSQTVLLSATLTPGVERLVDLALQKPQFIDESGIKDTTEAKATEPTSSEETSVADIPQQLKQFFVITPSKMRIVSLAAFILSKFKQKRDTKMIVFLSSRDSVDFHHSLFKQCLRLEEGKELDFYKLHGSMSQTERTDVFNKYSNSKEGILLCTDVAARGLDIQHVSWIIQYDTPGSAVDYIHRVGRTARIGSEGHALLFLTPAEVGYLETLAEHSIRPKELPVSSVLQTLVPFARKAKGKQGLQDHVIQEAATDLQMTLETHVLSSPEDLKAAKKAFQSFVRSYATFPASLKHIFHVHNLHLGHVAKAFALRDPPKGISGTEKMKKHQTKRTSKLPTKRPLNKRKLTTDEHSEGLDMHGPRPKKKKKVKLRI